MGVGVVEQAAQALGLLRVAFKALELSDQVHQHFAHLAGVLGLDGLQGRVGEIGDLLLGIRAEEQHMVGVAHVQLLFKLVNGLALGGGELAVVQAGRLFLGGGRLYALLLDGRHRLLQLRVGNLGGQGKLGSLVGFKHGSASLFFSWAGCVLPVRRLAAIEGYKVIGR